MVAPALALPRPGLSLPDLARFALVGVRRVLLSRRPVVVVAGGGVYGVTGCAFWADASQEAYANNATVTTIHDWSGNSHDLTTSGSPVFKTAIVNGKPVFRLDGVDDIASESAVSLAQPFTVIVVAIETGAQIGKSLLNSNAANTVQVFAASATKWQGEPGSIQSVAGNTGAWSIVSFVANGASAVVALNGATATGNAGTTGSTGVRLGANSGGAGLFTGDVAEVLVFPGLALSSTDRHSIETQLGTKYAITVS